MKSFGSRPGGPGFQTWGTDDHLLPFDGPPAECYTLETGAGEPSIIKKEKATVGSLPLIDMEKGDRLAAVSASPAVSAAAAAATTA